MTRLTSYADQAPFAPRATLNDFTAIAAAMAETGTVLERWETGLALPDDASDADVLAHHADDIARLKARGGYQSEDVVRLTPDSPNRAELRQKFLAEHIHDDDEVRFFVEGSGLFYIHHGGAVHALKCTAGDLIVLPAGTRHWFDTGEFPQFTAIRLFTTPDGWAANYTGDTIAEAIPNLRGATESRSPVTPRAILTDIEGTTSSLAFVHSVLFPYARARLAEHVLAHEADLAPLLDAVRAEVGDPALDTKGCIAQLTAWHDADRKIGPLKTLQGEIWAGGYADGALKGHVYADAAEGLRRWHKMGIALAVYSSGSVAAQRLWFGQSDFGDLTPLFRAHFDTAIGGKREAASYHRIATALALPPAEILFLSDIAEELAAAREAGLAVTLLARDGLPEACPYPVTTSFAAILPA